MNLANEITVHFVDDGDTRSDVDFAKSLATSLKQNAIDLFQIVQALRIYVTNERPETRARALCLLQRIVEELDSEILGRNQAEVLVQFFCDRLSDHACIETCLVALQRLMTLHTSLRLSLESIITSLGDEAQELRSLPQRSRFQGYKLLYVLLEHYRPQLKTSEQFLSVLIQLIEREKDPRNLMLIFEVMLVVLREFDLTNLSAELFDALYCYFPITFRASLPEHNEITSEGLKYSLRNCLCASPLFARFLIPALLEKLQAVAKSVKLDVLETLSTCCKNYTAQNMHTYTQQLWNDCLNELEVTDDPELHNALYDTLNSITRCLTTGSENSPGHNPLLAWLERSVAWFKTQIKHPSQKSAMFCGKILGSLLTASLVCLATMLKALLPLISAMLQEACDLKGYECLYNILYNFLIALGKSSFSETMRREQTMVEETFACHKTDLLRSIMRDIELNDRTHVVAQDSSIRCIVPLIQTSLLDDTEKLQLICSLCQVVIRQDGSIQNIGLIALTELASAETRSVADQAFPIFFAQLPDSSKVIDLRKSGTILQCLVALCRSDALRETFVIRALGRLDLSAVHKIQVHYNISLLRAILSILVEVQDDEHSGLRRISEKIVLTLISQLQTVDHNDWRYSKYDQLCAEVTNISTRIAGRNCYSDVFHSMLHTLASIEEQVLVDSRSDDGHLTVKTKVQVEGKLLCLFCAIFIASPDSGSIDDMDEDVLANNIINSFETVAPLHRPWLGRLLASIIYKANDDLLCTIIPVLSRKDPATGELLLWSLRALGMRKHKQAEIMLDMLCHALRTHEKAPIMAAAFHTVMKDDFFVSEANSIKARPLWKQKLFSQAFPRLQTIMQHDMPLSNSSGKSLFHVILCILILVRYTVESVVLTNANQIMPFVLRGLMANDWHIRLLAIQCLERYVDADAQILSEHLSSIVPRLLLQLNAEEKNSTALRGRSLKVLGKLADSVRPDRLQPYKGAVLAGTLKALDDPRRIVRSEAVNTRHRFYLV